MGKQQSLQTLNVSARACYATTISRLCTAAGLTTPRMSPEEAQILLLRARVFDEGVTVDPKYHSTLFILNGEPRNE